MIEEPSYETQRWMAEALRKCGWSVKEDSPRESALPFSLFKSGMDDKPAYLLPLRLQVHNALSRHFCGPEEKDYKGGEMTIHDLAVLVENSRDRLEQVRGLGEGGIQHIESAIEEVLY